MSTESPDIESRSHADEVKKKKIGIVVATWNESITSRLAEGAEAYLKEQGIPEDQIKVNKVPGAFELPLGAQYMIDLAGMDAVICIGCLVKGETPHFHYISSSVTRTLSQMNIGYKRPVIYGVLTVDTLEQAEERTGGTHGHKGREAAAAALDMLNLREELKTHGKEKQKLGFGY